MLSESNKSFLVSILSPNFDSFPLPLPSNLTLKSEKKAERLGWVEEWECLVLL